MKIRERQYLQRIQAAAEHALRRAAMAGVAVVMGAEAVEPIEDVASIMAYAYRGAHVARSTLGIGRIPMRRRSG